MRTTLKNRLLFELKLQSKKLFCGQNMSTAYANIASDRKNSL